MSGLYLSFGAVPVGDGPSPLELSQSLFLLAFARLWRR